MCRPTDPDNLSNMFRYARVTTITKMHVCFESISRARRRISMTITHANSRYWTIFRAQHSTAQYPGSTLRVCCTSEQLATNARMHPFNQSQTFSLSSDQTRQVPVDQSKRKIDRKIKALVVTVGVLYFLCKWAVWLVQISIHVYTDKNIIIVLWLFILC